MHPSELPLEDRWPFYFEYLVGGILPYTAARRLKIPAATLTARRKKDAEFVTAEEEALVQYSELVEKYIMDVAAGTDTPDKDRLRAAEMWLKVRHKKVWNTERDSTVNHKHTIELKSAGDILALQRQLEERQAKYVLDDPNIIDAEVVDDDSPAPT